MKKTKNANKFIHSCVQSLDHGPLFNLGSLGSSPHGRVQHPGCSLRRTLGILKYGRTGRNQDSGEVWLWHKLSNSFTWPHRKLWSWNVLQRYPRLGPDGQALYIPPQISYWMWAIVEGHDFMLSGFMKLRSFLKVLTATDCPRRWSTIPDFPELSIVALKNPRLSTMVGHLTVCQQHSAAETTHLSLSGHVSITTPLPISQVSQDIMLENSIFQSS